MELAIQTLVIIVIALIIVVVVVALATGWSGAENDMIKGLQTFFGNLLAGKTTPTMPKV